MYLDTTLSFTHHIKKTRAKAQAAQSNLYNLLNRRSSLSTKNKMILFKMMIRPILLYAAPIWSNTCKTNIQKLEAMQSKTLRMISKEMPNVTNDTIRNTLKINTFGKKSTREQKISLSFRQSILMKLRALVMLTQRMHHLNLNIKCHI